MKFKGELLEMLPCTQTPEVQSIHANKEIVNMDGQIDVEVEIVI